MIIPMSYEAYKEIEALTVHIDNQNDGKKRNTYMFQCHHEIEIKEFGEKVKEAGGFYILAIPTPFWNIHGQIIDRQFTIIYQHIEPIEMAVRT